MASALFSLRSRLGRTQAKREAARSVARRFLDARDGLSGLLGLPLVFLLRTSGRRLQLADRLAQSATFAALAMEDLAGEERKNRFLYPLRRLVFSRLPLDFGILSTISAGNLYFGKCLVSTRPVIVLPTAQRKK